MHDHVPHRFKSDRDVPLVTLDQNEGTQDYEDDEIRKLLTGKWYIRKSEDIKNVTKQMSRPDHLDLMTKIGSGGCGSVYLVKDRRTAKEYAVKRVPHVTTLQRAQNIRELLILQMFQHQPHIVHLEGFHSLNE